MAIAWVALVAILLAAATPASASEKALKTLQATVAAQSARIQSLEAQLRTGVCATPPKPSGGKQSKAPERCVPLDVDPEPELAAFRAGERRRAAAKKQELLTTVFNVSVGKPLTALAISSALVDHKGVPRLVAVADASGTLHLYDRAGELAASVPAAGETSAATISSIIFGTKDDPFVATGSVGGEVALYNLSLPRLRSSPTPASGGPLPPPPPTTLTLAMRAPPLLDERGAPIPVLTLSSYLRSRRTLLAVGDGSGALRLLHRNGTQRASVPVGGAVRVVERSKDSVHFAVAADGVEGIQLLDLSKSVPVPLVCALWGTTDEGAEVRASEGAEVVSLAWDVQLPQLLYAGTASGEMLVFNTKSRSRVPNKHGNGTEMMTVCKLVTVLGGHAPAPVRLAPLKGFLFSAADQLLAVHNVSGLYKRRLDEPAVFFGRSLPQVPVAHGGAAASGGATVGGGAAGAPLLAADESHVAVGAGAAGEVIATDDLW